MKRQVLVVALLILTAGLLFAAGGQETSKGATITFWMQNYGPDLNAQKTTIGDLAAKFEKETGIKVQLEINNWTEASQKWMLVVTGGDHPDVGDMFWAWSNVRIGKGKYGPMPLDKYKDQLHHERFYEKALVDVIYDGHVYGIPWRIDVRPMLYRADLVAEAGFKGPPDTWDDLITYGKKLTVKAADGKMERAGISFTYGVKSDSQEFMHWMWQGGGEAMTADGKTATLNTKEIIDAMQFVRDLVYKHEVVSKDVLDPSYNGSQLFVAGKAALRPHGTSDVSAFPKEMLAKVKPAIPTKGVRRTAYSGAGFFGVMFGTKYEKESVKWLEFLSRDESMLALAKLSLQYSPSKGASADAYFASDEWKRETIKCLEFAHTSQHPNAAWSQIAGRGPGSPLYDFWADVLLNKEPLPALAAKYNAKAQEMMDKANAPK